MRIILAEMRGEEKLSAREFSQPIIKIGRDQAQCTLVFDQKAWPTVSRLHAELRLQAGRYHLVDHSRHGTFLDGQRISSATAVQTGSRIQFGQQGPVVRVEL